MNAAPAGLARSSAWQPAYVGIGSNLDDPRRQVQAALGALEHLPHTRLVIASPLYSSAPFGAVVQPQFVNAAAGLLTQLTPEELLAELRRVERELGREPARERWGPRRIDLDLLAVGNQVRNSATLQLPHPGIAERDFVLYPLAHIAPDLELPGVGRIATLRARVADRGIEQL